FRDLPRPEHVFQLGHQGLAFDVPPLRSLDVVRHNLPEPLTSFIGREHELADVEAVLAANRLVTLTGAGGCGKTRLGLEAAGRAAVDYRDGVWWVDLAPVFDDSLVVSTVMAVFRVKEVASRDPLHTLRAFLAGKQLLL